MVSVLEQQPLDAIRRLAVQAGVHGHQPSFSRAIDAVIGSGTTLDTARFRALVGRQLKVDSQHIHAYVLGEHGDSEVLAWSQVSVGGIPLDEFCTGREVSICQDDYAAIDERVRRAAYHIIEGKGATYYGIGSAIARIVEVIQQDERSILTVCTPIEEVAGVKDVTVSLPNLVGGEGIIQTFFPNLNETETAALQNSARVVRSVIDQLGE
jgi:L-lactate dehydrogenase